jgi:hypothetical protein
VVGDVDGGEVRLDAVGGCVDEGVGSEAAGGIENDMAGPDVVGGTGGGMVGFVAVGDTDGATRRGLRTTILDYYYSVHLHPVFTEIRPPDFEFLAPNYDPSFLWFAFFKSDPDCAMPQSSSWRSIIRPP